MSRAALLSAAAAPQVFDPTPPPDTLGSCLAPYESLIDTCKLESDLRSRLRAYARIALIGPPGCGKSSVARYALAADDVAMILINVATERPKDIATVRGFLSILVSQLVNRAETAGRINTSQRQKLLAAAQPTLPLDRKLISYRAALSGGQWLLRGNVAREVTKTVGGGRTYNTTQALREAAAEALEVVGSHKLVPVLVADDTDRLGRVAGKASAKVLGGFFGDVLRDLADNLECGVLVAVHDSYLDAPDFDYSQLTAGLLQDMRMPKITQPEQLAAIISRRAAFLTPACEASDLIASDALKALIRLHRGEHACSVRRTLSVLAPALSLAVGDDATEHVCARHVDAVD
jgi:hypothetical protein